MDKHIEHIERVDAVRKFVCIDDRVFSPVAP